jgi:adenosylmethionine-8-amino-7-oxononanoate aminotransferase
VSAVDFVSTTLAPALIDAGVLCRAAVDHEGTPLVQFSPPLVFTREDIDTLVTRVRAVLDLSAARLEMAG